MTISVINECLPGGKISKPKELKGIKPCFSYKWGGITACQVFICGNDVWVKHNDWCSNVLYGKDNKYRKHFVYSDGFTAPVIKGQAYIRLKNVVYVNKKSEILRQVVQECLIKKSRFCMDDERMFNDILRKVWGIDR